MKGLENQSSVLFLADAKIFILHDGSFRKHAKAVEKEQERSLKWARMAKRQPGQIEIEYTFPESSKVSPMAQNGLPVIEKGYSRAVVSPQRAAQLSDSNRLLLCCL